MNVLIALGAMIIDGTEGYAEESSVLAAQMEAMTFEQVHEGVLHLLPAAPATALDIGAGTGRDAAALVRRGYRVTAVEPVKELRQHVGRDGLSGGIQWVDDRLPGLEKLCALRPNPYSLVLASAVWMHLSSEDRRIAMFVVGGLLAGAGTFILTVRHGPIPQGRHMFSVSDDETIQLARSAGLIAVHHAVVPDLLGRQEMSWSALAFRLV